MDGKIEELKSGCKPCTEKISMLTSLAASTGDERDKMIDHSRSWQRWSRGRCKQTARADSNPKVCGGQERISVVVGSIFQLCG